MATDPDTYLQHYTLQQTQVHDGVTWKAAKLMEGADDDPDALDQAADQVATMLAAIPQPMKRDQYLNMIPKNHKALKKQVLNKLVNGKVGEQEKKQKQQGSDEKDPEQSDFLPEGVDEKEAENYKNYRFFEWKGAYWSFGHKGEMYDVTNFTMQILFHIETNQDEAYRLMKIKNIHGHEREVVINTDDFVSVQSFRKIVGRLGNFIFKGNDVDLFRLQDKLQREEKATERVRMLGYNNKYEIFAFANGIIDTSKSHDNPNEAFIPVDEFGIVHMKDRNFFLPAMSKMYKDKEEMFTNDKRFVFIPNNVSFQDWAKQYIKVWGDEGKIGMMFYISALFRDIIKEVLNNRFPLLNLYGVHGSGKTTFAESIQALFGKPQQPLELGGSSTPIGYARTMAQYSNSIVLLDEYSNSLKRSYIDFLKGIYQGTGYTRGKKSNDLDTDNIVNNSAAMLAGQEMPTFDTALFERVIMLTFAQKSFSDNAKKDFDALKDMEAKGLSKITAYMQRYRKHFEQDYRQHFRDAFERIRKRKDIPVDMQDRMILNTAALAATCKMIEQYETLPFTATNFEDVAVANMLKQHRVLAGADDLSKFWDVVESLLSQELIEEGKHFELKDGELWLHLKNVHGLYSKELRQRGDSNMLAFSTLQDYLESSPAFLGRARKAFSNGDYPRIMRFDYKKLDVNLIRRAEAKDLADKFKNMGIPVPDELQQEPWQANGHDNVRELNHEQQQEQTSESGEKAEGEDDDMPF